MESLFKSSFALSLYLDCSFRLFPSLSNPLSQWEFGFRIVLSWDVRVN
jgi:hypothetical protein